jgi:hypothetical protein
MVTTNDRETATMNAKRIKEILAAVRPLADELIAHCEAKFSLV